MSIIQPRTTEVTIYQGDYLDRIRHLERQYDAAVKSEQQTTRMLGEMSKTVELADQHKALVKEAEESAVTIVLTALGRKVWRDLVAEHPPRKDDKNDAQVGVNEDSFKDPLIRASIVSPELSDEDLDMLSEADNDRLYLNCWALNRAPAADPKVLGSQKSTENAAT